MKFFTLREAEALIPELEDIFANALKIRDQAEAKAGQLREMEQGADPGRISETAIERSKLQFLVNSVNEWLRKIVDLGAVPKGLDPALVDFPFRLGEDEVYLCWKMGEKRITHYHGPDEGYTDRKPLPKDARA